MPQNSRLALVTGATGFTGGRLARTLIDRGYGVRALARDPSSMQARTLEDDGIEIFQGDVTDPDAIDTAMRGTSHVFHIAAVYRSANHPDDYYFAVNRDSVAHVLSAAEKHNVERIVHCSTCGVHGDVATVPAYETTDFNPGDIYQQSKLAGEKLAQRAIDEGAPVSIVRPTGIYGPGDTRFLKLFRSIQNRTFRMIGSGEIAYHMSFIDDLVDGIILCGEHKAAIGETFLIGSDEYTTLNGLVDEIASALGTGVPKGRIPVAPVMAAAVLCEFVCRPFGIDPPLHRRRVSFFTKARAFSVDKAKGLIGFEPKVGLSEGISRTSDWYRSMGYLKRA